VNQEQLYHKLAEISDVDDFVLELKPIHSKAYWGRYFPARKLIRLYALDENGEQYDEAILLKEGLHELTHHIQYNHIPFWERKHGVMHDEMFWEIYKGMMNKAFHGGELYGN
jgi:hypothetical protein